jgi:hypothetical protein
LFHSGAQGGVAMTVAEMHSRRYQVRALDGLGYPRHERRLRLVKRRWDLRSLTIGRGLLALIALCLFALVGCITVSINYPTSDSQAQVEPSVEASPTTQLDAFGVHSL